MRVDPRLRAWVRYTDSGTLVQGSLVMRKKRPAGRNWRELATNICCTTSTTTSTTSTSTTTTTTTTAAP